VVDDGGSLIVQSDMTVLLETASPSAAEARDLLARFAALEKAPEHIHTYRITPLSLWNAAVVGVSPEEVVDSLTTNAKYDIAPVVLDTIEDLMGRYGRLWLTRVDEQLLLVSEDPLLLDEMVGVKSVAEFLGRRIDPNSIAVRHGDRGPLKQALLAVGWPPADEAGFEAGTSLGPLKLEVDVRPYQQDALSAWWCDGEDVGGNGVVAMPCGAGKTIVGLAAIAEVGAHALVVCTTVSSIRQWIREAVDRTSLTEDDVGEWSGARKQLRKVTFVTYHSLTWSDPAADADAELEVRHPNLGLFNSQNWGVIIYDEVHLLPAPVFRATARIQAVRRLGLTATLVREDNREGDIFSLIGPIRYNAPWSELEAAGWIAPAVCTEVRVPLGEESRRAYAAAEPRKRHRVASTASEKMELVESLVKRHSDEQVLVIGQFVEQLREVSERFGAPLLTGQTSQKRRDTLFSEFRDGEIPMLVVSKVANFSIDLPDVAVAIQISGQFGSRQEEAQRLGRVLRPKSDGRQAHFYTLVADATDEAKFARNRQRFLAEQGYTYNIVDAHEVK